MAYRPKRASRHKTYHRTVRARVFVANSVIGTMLAIAKLFGWIDNDFHLSKDLAWVNAHGAPEKVWLSKKGDKFEHHTWAQLQKLEHSYAGHVYHLRDAHTALHDNAQHNLKHVLNTEIEVKDVRPLDSAANLDVAFERLSEQCKSAYGPDWQKHVIVKVLTNIGGGPAYALKICYYAHKHGFTTVLLARGKARFNRFSGYTQVSQVRGSLVVR